MICRESMVLGVMKPGIDKLAFLLRRDLLILALARSFSSWLIGGRFNGLFLSRRSMFLLFVKGTFVVFMKEFPGFGDRWTPFWRKVDLSTCSINVAKARQTAIVRVTCSWFRAILGIVSSYVSVWGFCELDLVACQWMGGISFCPFWIFQNIIFILRIIWR